MRQGEGETITNDKQKAELMNNFYVNIGKSMSVKLPSVSEDKNSLIYRVTPTITDIQVSNQGIRKHVKKVKPSKASGPDNVKSKDIALLGDSISVGLEHVHIKSIELRKYPDLWKLAKVKSAYKKGEHVQVENYRPLSMLSIPGKILEAQICDPLEEHLTKQGLLMRSLKYYSEDLYVKKLKEIDFPDYSNFKDINEAYSDFTGKVASVIDEIAPIKEVRVKSNSQDWFDAEINEEIERRDKLLTKFKKSRSHSDNENYKKSRNKVQRMIKDKKKNFVIGKLNDNIGKPKELWKSLKSLGLPSKANSAATICLEKDGILSFDPKTNAEIFKDFYSNLANNLVKKLPTPPNKYGKTAVNNYYKKLNLKGKNFSFAPVAPATILKLLKQLNPAKSAGIDNLTGKFLKEGAPVLASPITDLVNLSVSLSLFPDDCKIAKLKPLYKKEAKTKPKNYPNHKFRQFVDMQNKCIMTTI